MKGAGVKDHDQRVVHSSEDPNWRTPRPLFDALDKAFRFNLDGAADASSSLCPTYCGPRSLFGEDGLTTPWGADCTVFLNPPYSRKLLRATKNPAYDIANWAAKCWRASFEDGATIVGLFPFTPQTEWYRRFVYGHSTKYQQARNAFMGAAMEEWRLAHRVSFDAADGRKTSGAGHNVVVIIWRPNPGFVGPWQPTQRYWSYR